jgi:hypothetical protein
MYSWALLAFSIRTIPTRVKGGRLHVGGSNFRVWQVGARDRSIFNLMIRCMKMRRRSLGSLTSRKWRPSSPRHATWLHRSLAVNSKCSMFHFEVCLLTPLALDPSFSEGWNCDLGTHHILTFRIVYLLRQRERGGSSAERREEGGGGP